MRDIHAKGLAYDLPDKFVYNSYRNNSNYLQYMTLYCNQDVRILNLIRKPSVNHSVFTLNSGIFLQKKGIFWKDI